MCRYLASLTAEEVGELKTAARLHPGDGHHLHRLGRQHDRPGLAFDIVPRIIPLSEMATGRSRAQQRSCPNLFIDDLYHDRRIIKDGVFPAELLEQSVNFRQQCVGISPPRGIWAHICGSDLVRDKDGTIYVLEDNLRIPSGVSPACSRTATS